MLALVLGAPTSLRAVLLLLVFRSPSVSAAHIVVGLRLRVGPWARCLSKTGGWKDSAGDGEPESDPRACAAEEDWLLVCLRAMLTERSLLIGFTDPEVARCTFVRCLDGAMGAEARRVMGVDLAGSGSVGQGTLAPVVVATVTEPSAAGAVDGAALSTTTSTRKLASDDAGEIAALRFRRIGTPPFDVHIGGCSACPFS